MKKVWQGFDDDYTAAGVAAFISSQKSSVKAMSSLVAFCVVGVAIEWCNQGGKSPWFFLCTFSSWQWNFLFVPRKKKKQKQ